MQHSYNECISGNILHIRFYSFVFSDAPDLKNKSRLRISHLYLTAIAHNGALLQSFSVLPFFCCLDTVLELRISSPEVCHSLRFAACCCIRNSIEVSGFSSPGMVHFRVLPLSYISLSFSLTLSMPDSN